MLIILFIFLVIIIIAILRKRKQDMLDNFADFSNILELAVNTMEYPSDIGEISSFMEEQYIDSYFKNGGTQQNMNLMEDYISNANNIKNKQADTIQLAEDMNELSMKNTDVLLQIQQLNKQVENINELKKL
jgi:hypothetical protein